MKVLATVLFFLFVAAGRAVEPAQKAPDFALKDTGGKEVKLSDYIEIRMWF